MCPEGEGSGAGGWSHGLWPRFDHLDRYGPCGCVLFGLMYLRTQSGLGLFGGAVDREAAGLGARRCAIWDDPLPTRL